MPITPHPRNPSLDMIMQPAFSPPARSRLRGVAQSVIVAWGWKRRLIALFSGALGALAMAPLDLFPALIVSMCVAVWLVDGSAQGEGRVSLASLRAAAGAGWWWGFGYFLAGLWWLGAAFLVEAETWAWALPLGVVVLPACLALFPALGFAIARFIWTPSASRVLALAVALTASEWLRGHVLSGFPWNDLGMALGGPIWLAQVASLCGLYGLTLLAVALAASPAPMLAAASAAGGRRLLAAAVVVFALVAGFGAARLWTGVAAMVPNVVLRIVQPNVPQDASFTAANKEAILGRYLALSDRPMSPQRQGIASFTHIIWPESAFPFLLSQDPAALARIGAALPPGVRLITGAARAGERQAGDRQPRFHNSIQVVESGGVIAGTYDKLHLVPFGEYLPGGDLLRGLGLAQFVHVPGGFEPGDSRALMDIGGLPPVLPLICYEAIFPDAAAAPRSARGDARPGLLLNLTNDSWFGVTSGPHQHLAQARLRAIEQGLPLVRAANTGISAVLDPYGRILESLPLGVEGVLDGSLPKALPPTLFARFGDWIALAMWLLAFAVSQIFRRTR